MALIDNTDDTIFPYNDDDMAYDIDRHMYVLTDKGVAKLCGFELETLTGSSAGATLARYRVSQDIYNIIGANSLVKTIKYKKYQMAKDGDIRETLKQVFAEQMLYYKESGAGVLKTQHGVNIANGKVIDLKDLRGRVLLSPSSEMLLNSIGLLYTGSMYVLNYSEDGTW